MAMDHKAHQLLVQFKEILDGSPWLDETFEKKLSGISEDEAFSRPGGEHSVAEIISHLVEWRKELLNRLKGMPRQMQVTSDKNWIDNATLQESGWKVLWDSFMVTQKQIYDLLEQADDQFINEGYEDMTNGWLIRGLLHHDIYHLGQIGLILKRVRND